MYISFEKMPPHARIWVYQASESWSDTATPAITDVLKKFCTNWNSHGKDLHTSFLLYENQFIILSINEQAGSASGCSIDSSVAVIRELETALGVSFLDRSRIAFRNKQEIELIPVIGIKQALLEGKLSPETITFNNLVQTKSQWEKEWQIPISNTWMKRYLVDAQ